MNRPPHGDAATQRARLDAGDWLTPGEVAKLFGNDRITRWSVIDWIKAGKIGYRQTPGGHRICKPADVRKLLDDYEREHRDTS